MVTRRTSGRSTAGPAAALGACERQAVTRPARRRTRTDARAGKCGRRIAMGTPKGYKSRPRASSRGFRQKQVDSPQQQGIESGHSYRFLTICGSNHPDGGRSARRRDARPPRRTASDDRPAREEDMMRTRVPSILLLTALATAGAVSAQSFLGTIRGTVTDPQGRAVKDAAVLVVDESTGIPRAVSTDSEGRFEATARACPGRFPLAHAIGRAPCRPAWPIQPVRSAPGPRPAWSPSAA